MRNMATGASTADASVVLIDAVTGVLVQSRRPAYMASLLRVRHVIVAVNKMDLVGYDEQALRAIEHDFGGVLEQIATDTGNPVEASFVPVSALKGDNLVHRTSAMPWYQGSSLLELLEALPPAHQSHTAQFRFPVQRVLRPDYTFRASLARSFQVRFAREMPSRCFLQAERRRSSASSRGTAISTKHSRPCRSRWCLIANSTSAAAISSSRRKSRRAVSKTATGALVWMDQQPLELNRRYRLKHTSHTVPAFIPAIHHRTDVATLMR
jgi:sulfate adenylyltransferase subunit 1 (EFTu-like GTPase family)